MDVDHAILPKKFEEKVNFPLRNVLATHLVKKRPNVFHSKISEFFWCERSF
jgi:hypothetical protein